MKSVRILTPDKIWLGEIDDYESLQFKRCFNKVGSFELHINLNKNLTETLLEEHLVVLSNTKVGVILHREIDRENSDNLIVRGYTLSGHISRRITVPPVGLAYDRIKAPIESVMKHYVRQNTIEPTDVTRIIKQLTIEEDLLRGDAISWESRYKQLDEELEKMTMGTNFGWDIHLDDDVDGWVFKVLESRNLTETQTVHPPVIFAIDFDNIKGHKFIQSSVNYKNTAYVGGQGEGEVRRIVELGDSSGLDRIELFVDARDVAETDSDETPIPESEIITRLTERGQQKIKEFEKIQSFESEILTNGPFIYEQDWDLGDVVTVTDPKIGVTLDSPITEVTEIYESGGFRLDVAFGNTTPTLTNKIKQIVDTPVL